ncbi:MAG: hypothetical protein JKY09_00855 [Crocinitomicaceae bacterium]|nr:hypothetical protein [Crocinitomicaceae bacterium]
MKKLWYVIFASCVGCTTGVSLNSVDYHTLFHDSNSKVWIINKVVSNGMNIAPANDWSKDVIVFHESRNVNLIPLKGMGHVAPRKGEYFLNSQKRTLKIEFKDATWDMDISYITEDSVLMKAARNSDVKFSIQLMPLPEL